MNVVLTLVALLALAAVVVHLGRLVARDGYGSNPAPRSHSDELGTRVDKELRR